MCWQDQSQRLAALFPPLQSTARIGEKSALGLRTVNKNPRGIETSSKRKSTDDVPAFKHKSSQSLPCKMYDMMVCITIQSIEVVSSILDCLRLEIVVFTVKNVTLLMHEQYSQLLSSVSHQIKLTENYSATK